MEAFEHPRQFILRDAYTGVFNHKLHFGIHSLKADLDSALKGKFKCIRDQVEDNLLPHVAVNINRLVQRRAVHSQLQTGAFDCRAESAGQVGGQLAEIGGPKVSFNPSRLNAGKVKESVDELKQAQAIAVHQAEFTFPPRFGTITCQQVFQRPKHESKWGSELVTHIPEEECLGAI